MGDGGAKLPTAELARAGRSRRDRAELGDREAAALLHATLEPHARLFPVVARGGVCIGSAQYFLARLANALGRPDEAELRLRRAITENLRIGAGPRATIALARLGELTRRPRHAARGGGAGRRAGHARCRGARPARRAAPATAYASDPSETRAPSPSSTSGLAGNPAASSAR